MKTYKEFHGQVPINYIGQRLREIAKIEKTSFKIMTGYGSTSGISQSKSASIKSLSKMKKEGVIVGFLPGEVKNMVLRSSSPNHESKIMFEKSIKTDPDYGNDGIIFVFVKKI